MPQSALTRKHHVLQRGCHTCISPSPPERRKPQPGPGARLPQRAPQRSTGRWALPMPTAQWIFAAANTLSGTEIP